MADKGSVTRKAARSFFQDGKLLQAGDEISISKQRAAELDANGLLEREKGEDNVVQLSPLQQTGRPNAEPTPTPFPGDPVTPAPGDGIQDRPELTAEQPVDPGTTNPEPEPDTTFGEVSPAPGQPPQEPVQAADEPAERAASKVKEHKAPNDPGAAEEDNYAVPLSAITTDPNPGAKAVVSQPAQVTPVETRAADPAFREVDGPKSKRNTKR